MEDVAVQLKAIVEQLDNINSTLFIYGAMLIGVLFCIVLKEFKVVVPKPPKEDHEPPKEFGL